MNKFITILTLSGLLFGMSSLAFTSFPHKHSHYKKTSSYKDLGGGSDEISTYAVSSSKTNLVKYYTNLTNNFGNNFSQSTCGYVAMGMLLTYYDAILNGNIVPSVYDAKSNYSSIKLDTSTAESPGSDFDTNSSFANPQIYWNHLNVTQHTNLHAKLCIIGTTYDNSTSSLENMTYMNVFGTSLDINLYTLNSYLQSLSTSFSYTIDYKAYDKNVATYGNATSYDQVFDFIIDEIDAGRPVLIGFNGHARIAYNYGYTNEHIFYLHEGYVDTFKPRLTTNGQLKLSYLNSNESSISGITKLSAISLHFDDSTTVSPGYNYHSTYYNDDNTFFGAYTNHNTHYYTYNCRYISNNYHYNYCKCGLYQQELHAYRKDITYSEQYCTCGAENPYYNSFGGLSSKEEEYEE